MVVLNADSYQTLVGEITTARITKKPSLKTRLFYFVRLEYITLIFNCVAHNINAIRSSVLFQNAIKPLSAAWCNQ